MQLRYRSRALRTLLALIALAIIAAGCSSDDGETAAPDSATESDLLATPPTIDVEGPANPEDISGLVSQLLQVDVAGDDLTCLVEDADGDTQLTEVYNGINTQGFQLSPEGFTALMVSTHGCFESETLATAVVPLAGATEVDEITAFSSCVAEQVEAEPNGDLAFTGLMALLFQFPVPEGSQPVTVDAASACVTGETVARQLAAGREQASGFRDEVDTDCVAEGLDADALAAFWNGVVTGTSIDATSTELVDPCTMIFDSGLPTEIPVSFEPWAGEGVLAGVDPLSRADAYDGPPPNQLVDGVDYQAVLTTDDGEIVIDLFEETAPITVNSFVSLARDGYYDGTIFHRVLDGFMAQGGDPTGLGTGGPGFSYDDEQSALTPVDRRGLLAMANSGPNTNGSQFFITFEAASHLNGLHAVFGEVVEGDETLEMIERRDPAAPASRGEELISVEIIEG